MHMDTFLQNDRNVIVTENERKEGAQNLRVICVPSFSLSLLNRDCDAIAHVRIIRFSLCAYSMGLHLLMSSIDCMVSLPCSF